MFLAEIALNLPISENDQREGPLAEYQQGVSAVWCFFAQESLLNVTWCSRKRLYWL